jgi:tetratricopeptide (TPR) repeat protein
MASTLSRAAQIAPSFADYHFRRGYALVQLAEAGNPDSYEEAKEPLQTCIEKDPNLAECYYWLGWAMLWTDHEQDALANLTKAVEADGVNHPYFYPTLAQLYLALRFYDEAEKVLNEGVKLIQPTTEKARNALFGIYTLLSDVHLVRGDDAKRIGVLEKANEVAGEEHPEIAFSLGSTYAVKKPPEKEKALRLLKSFDKRSCKGAKAKDFKALCEQARDLLQRLGEG